MSAPFEKIIAKTFVILFLILLVACAGITPKADNNAVRASPAITQPIVRIKPKATAYFADLLTCPKYLVKLCDSFNILQNRYITRISDDELTAMYLKGIERYGVTVTETHPAPFACSKHLQKLCDAFDMIQSHGVKKLSNEKLTEMFIKGVIDEIRVNDPYSRYTPLGTKDSFSSRYSGVGLITNKDSDSSPFLVIRQVIKGSPAYRAGLKRGDKIIRIRGVSVAGKTQKEATMLIRGNEGTPVTLTVLGGCNGKERSVTLIRRNIRDGTTGIVETIDKQYAYVHIQDFMNNPAESVAYSMERWEQIHGTPKGFIIDLRENPGGSVMQSVKFIGLFVESGDALYEKQQDGRYVPWQIPKRSEDIIPGVPIVVLVNDGSASASELVSGALKDFGRATIVGTNTYGKGVMQTKIFLKDKSEFHLTIAYTFTPKKTAIHKVGIAPDVLVPEGANESCTGDAQLAAALKILHEKGK
ncbi:MAG: S41 family peptidase [Candidatus Paceibacterota bacterium]|jgi:carboxyl-terminal processing protease